MLLLCVVLQPSVQAPVSTGCEPVVMCITDDEVNHILLEGILQSQGYRCALHSSKPSEGPSVRMHYVEDTAGSSWASLCCSVVAAMHCGFLKVL